MIDADGRIGIGHVAASQVEESAIQDQRQLEDVLGSGLVDDVDLAFQGCSSDLACTVNPENRRHARKPDNDKPEPCSLKIWNGRRGTRTPDLADVSRSL